MLPLEWSFHHSILPLFLLSSSSLSSSSDPSVMSSLSKISRRPLFMSMRTHLDLPFRKSQSPTSVLSIQNGVCLIL
ncbi:hypothetical protein HanIR_Chr11g0545771 [Helianthus annuus]|nr:hypothetical protein HanIR_Chr11g0545771 [Helianthus annuus]